MILFKRFHEYLEQIFLKRLKKIVLPHNNSLLNKWIRSFLLCVHGIKPFLINLSDQKWKPLKLIFHLYQWFRKLLPELRVNSETLLRISHQLLHKNIACLHLNICTNGVSSSVISNQTISDSWTGIKYSYLILVLAENCLN